jgi:DHA1 family multidrug resistance protein-like MFS transporter
MVSLPVVEAVGFAPVYAACALIRLVACGLLVVGVYTQAGSLNPRTATTSGD